MNRLFSFIVLACSYILCGAQATTLTIDNQTPGWLSSKINYGDQQTVENLTVTGYLNGDDLEFIKSLNVDRNLRGALNIENSNIVKGGIIKNDNELSYNSLTGMLSLRKIVYPKNATVAQAILEARPQCDTVIITNTNLTELHIGTYARSNTKFVYIPDGVESLKGGFVAANTGIRFPSSIKSITDGVIKNARIFAEMQNPEAIISIYETYNSKDGRQQYPAVSNSTIYVPQGMSERYKNSKLKDENNTIIEYYNLDKLVAPSTIEIFAESDTVLEVKALPDSNLISYYVFSSSDREIATVSNDGAIFANKFGTCVINFEAKMVSEFSKGLRGSCEVKVYSHVCGISIENNILIALNDIYHLDAQLYPLGETNSKIKWESDNTDVAIVDEQGNVKGISLGTSTITATSEDGCYSADCVVTVVQSVESITVSPKSIDLKAGENAQLSVELLPENAIDKSVSWRSSDESIVRVDEFGNITAVSGGLAKVYATSNYDNSLSDYCDIKVIQPVTGVVLNETSIDLPVDGNFKLNATVIPENATNKIVTWDSSDVSVAMVNADGMVYGIKAGKATIMVTTEDGAFSALCKVNVNCGFVPVAEITLDTTNIEGKETEEYLIKANVLPEDASNKILLWRSSDETVASVDNTGLIRLLKKGSSIITVSATDESGVFAECIVLVSEQAGIDEVLADKNTYVKIYNLSGVLVFEGNYSDANLDSGYYIVLCGGKSHSVIVEK